MTISNAMLEKAQVDTKFLHLRDECGSMVA